MKRLTGSAFAFGALGTAMGAGYQAINGTTDAQQKALDRFVAPYEIDDKKFITKEAQPDGTNKYYYQNWSNNNAYDYLEAPFRTLLKRVQKGIDNEEQLSRGFVEGISEAFSRALEPFVSESIAPEAIIDILVREGVTREGKKLYTDSTPVADKIQIAIKHITKTQIPFSKAQFERLYYAARDLPDPRTGIRYEVEKELPGLIGWRLREIDPIRSIGFKITKYDQKRRNDTREFTSGDSRLLSGGVKTKEEVIRQFFIANRALFDTQQTMHLDLKAANEFEASDQQLAAVFQERNSPAREYIPLFTGQFNPYIPSQGLARKFYTIAQDTGVNPFQEAMPVIEQMIRQFQKLRLDQSFGLKLEDFGIQDKEDTYVDPLKMGQLETPGVNPELVQNPMMNNMNVMQTGLTPTEQALLLPWEKAVRLKNRGMG